MRHTIKSTITQNAIRQSHHCLCVCATPINLKKPPSLPCPQPPNGSTFADKNLKCTHRPASSCIVLYRPEKAINCVCNHATVHACTTSVLPSTSIVAIDFLLAVAMISQLFPHCLKFGTGRRHQFFHRVSPTSALLGLTSSKSFINAPR